MDAVDDARAPASRSSPFGLLLLRYRLAAKLSQEALAERARLSVDAISALERGTRRSPQRETVALLAGALQLNDEQGRAFAAAASRPSVPRTRQGTAADPVVESDAADTKPAPPNNLPTALSTFIGRATELAQINLLVREHRLVTITGAGGIGKTRAALEVGKALSNIAEGGVWLVELAPLRDPSMVAAAIASALGMQESANRPLLETLQAFLKRKMLLLVLDNCEHVIAEAARVADSLSRGCPGLRILTTCREPLRVEGERIYRLPSLAAPPLDADRISAVDAAGYEAIALFTERAQANDYRFAITDENAPLIAEICCRLDGIPLAIELAAARVRFLPVKVLSERLDQRLALLTGGSRTVLPRHQTMRALIDWSYDLLDPREQRLFESLSVFAGGFTFEAVTAIVTGENAVGADAVGDPDVFELLSLLVDKSLLMVDFEGSAPRYRLAESSRQYAREKLVMRGEQAAVARRHALFYLELAEYIERGYDTEPDRVWRPLVREELDNWRAALDWALARRGDVALAQRLVGALYEVWAHIVPLEGRRWLASALEFVETLTPARVLAKLEIATSWIASCFYEHGTTLSSAERAMLLYRELGDALETARAQFKAGDALLFLGRVAEGEQQLREALTVARGLGKKRLTAAALRPIAWARGAGGDLAGARANYAEARDIYAPLGAQRGLALIDVDLAELEFRAGDAVAALRHASDALATLRALKDTLLDPVLANTAAYLVALDRYDEAETFAREALGLAHDQQRSLIVTITLQHFGALAALRTDVSAPNTARAHALAARLLGLADARLTALGALPRDYTEQQEYDRVVNVLRDLVDAGVLAEQMAVGAAMSEDQAIAEALARPS
jgi:predicted ATPase/transcriptional regulator with XRE-family HTH domain